MRVVPSDDPASFESGSDLLRFNGQIWSRPLFVLSKYYVPLYKKLTEEGLVPGDLKAALSTFLPKLPRCQLLYTLNDTFIIDFSVNMMHFYVVTEQGVEPLDFRFSFSDSREMWGGSPYTGAYTNHHLSILL